jgi:hypothetical protein
VRIELRADESLKETGTGKGRAEETCGERSLKLRSGRMLIGSFWVKEVLLEGFESGDCCCEEEDEVCDCCVHWLKSILAT